MSVNRITIAGAVLGVLGAGLLAVFVVQTSGSADNEPTVSAFVVTEDLPAGLAGGQLSDRVERRELPESLAPNRAVRDLDEVAGTEVVRPVGVGEVLTQDQLADPGPASGGLVVPDGYEALSIEASPAPGVQGYVTPGDIVNVYVTVEDDSSDSAGGAGDGGDPVTGTDSAGRFTQRVLGHVEVLAVTRGTLTGESQSPDEADAEQGIVLLLQLRPQDAPVLVHAERSGELWFSLANPDNEPPEATRVDLDAFAASQRTEAIRQATQQRSARATEGDDGAADVAEGAPANGDGDE